jgi:predicted Zn-dependent protease
VVHLSNTLLRLDAHGNSYPVAIRLAANLVPVDVIPWTPSVFTPFGGYLQYFPFVCIDDGTLADSSAPM